MADLIDNPILAAEGVVAGYGGRPIVKGVDITLRRGEILGLLGANGAGKSTLVKALTGQIRLIGGSVTIGGIDMARAPERAKAQLGLAVDISEVPSALTGRQYLELVASIRGCTANAWPADDLVITLNLERWIGRPIATYSLGTRMKISVAASLLGSPPLIIFDESLNGLDPVAAFNMKRMIRSLAAAGRHAIILATHVVETIPSLCTRAIFLAGGVIARSWDRDALTAAGAPGEFEREVIAALGEKEPA